MTRFIRVASVALVIVPLVTLNSCRPDGQGEPDRLSVLLSRPAQTDLEQIIPAIMDSGDVTGLSIALTGDTGIFWSEGFGIRNRKTDATVDTATVFEAASLSKPVFAYAFLKMVDEGRFNLDTPISEYYNYPDLAHQELCSRITPRIILTHSSGLPNWRPRGEQLTIDFEPGSEFSYSGEGFVYLQRAVSEGTGKSLEEIAARLVFEPLGMESSSYLWQEEFEERIAMPHGPDGETRNKYKPLSGRANAAASLHTTAPDYARFIRAVMNGTGLSDSTSVAMLSPQVEVDSNVTWGLGVGLQTNEYGRGFWHWGDNSGYKAYTLCYPERGIGVVWFTNSENGHTILHSMLELIFGGQHSASTWLDYEQYDSPGRFVRQELERVYADAGIDSAIARYRELKATQPPEAFDESLLNSLGYRLLGNERIADAITTFELNVAEYPNASNPYDSLGEAYLIAGDTARAVVNYRRAVELDPGNSNGLEVLERLGAGRG